jgi:hypothetical protein
VTTGAAGGRLARSAPWATGVILAVFAGLRVLATVGLPVSVWPDSASYFDFRLWGGVRFPVVTAPYALLGDPAAVVGVQAVVGAVAWSLGLLVAARLVTALGVRLVFLLLGCALGLTPPVTTFDRALLSESFAISLTVLLVATLLHFACRPGRTAAAGVLGVGVLWGLARPSQALLLGFAAALLAALGSVRSHRRWAWPVAAALAAVAVVGGLLASSTSQVQEYNSAQIVVQRVLTDDERSGWFEARGMPDTGAALLATAASRFRDPAVELQDDPRFGPWLRDGFTGVYLRYLLSHPGYAVGQPLSQDTTARALVGTDEYGSARAVLPGPVVEVFWPRSYPARLAAVVVALVVLAAGVAAAVGSPGRRRALAGAGGVLLVAVANLVLVTHTAGWEYERLLLPVGVGARLALIWLTATLLGGVTVSGRVASAGPAWRWRRRGAGRTAPAADRAPSTPGPAAPGDSPGAIAVGPGPGRSGTP